MTDPSIPHVERLRPSDPTSIAQYRLLGRLGAGGMGVVYLGQDPRGGRVTVKLVRPDLAEQPEFRDRFSREVRAARRVRGPHTARVLDADTSGRRQWVATEYVDGPTLDAHIARHGPLTIDQVTSLGQGLADGLASIHAAGVVHRDLKPSNVILAADGPKVIDFGIARAVEATGLTATGTVLGTLQWTSPEQLTGSPVTSASDTFAWGLVVYFAATGRHPFGEGRPEAIAFRIVHHRADTQALPRPLTLAVGASLDPDPQRRPSPRHLAMMLTAADGMPASPTRIDTDGDDVGPGSATVVHPATSVPGPRWSPVRLAAIAASSAVLLGLLGALATGAGPLVADRVAAMWNSLAADEVAADDIAADAGIEADAEEPPSLPAPTPTPTPETAPATPTPPAAADDSDPPSRSTESSAERSGTNAAPGDTVTEPVSDQAMSGEQAGVGDAAPEFRSSCTWDPPQPSPTLATAVLLSGQCDGVGEVRVEAEALTALASETGDSQVLVSGNLAGNDLYLQLYPSAPKDGVRDRDQRWWSWSGSTHNGRGDPVSVLGTQRVDRATGQTWWEIGGDNLAAEADAELGVGLVTTMGGTYENFECVGPRGTLTGSETRWPATGQVRGIHYEHDWLDTPMAAAVCSLITHAVPASGIAIQP